MKDHVRDMAILMRYEQLRWSDNRGVRSVAHEFGVTSEEVRRIIAAEKKSATSGGPYALTTKTGSTKRKKSA